ncbi:MarR family winged helix-turn-helix transcriptional regulator [Lacticaseibacillus thailandensis]|nr:MarR family winged helix-turn-helix transcriptional regulator [Lacticaseibacillus thailandensis]
MGLNATSAYILLLLHQQGDSSQNDLARTLVINKGQIAREVHRLSTDSYVSQTQSPDNRTTNIIHITTAGEAIIPEIIAIRNQWWQARLEHNHIDPDDSFQATLQKLSTELKDQHHQS